MADILEFPGGRDAAGSTHEAAAADGRGTSGSYEHPVPQPGERAHLTYPAKAGSVAIDLTCTPDLHAVFTITAPAADVKKIANEARTSLARAMGVDARDLASMRQVEQALGKEALDAYVSSYVQGRFFSKAVERTGIVPFMAPSYPSHEAPEDGEDFTFTADALMHPHAELSSYDPVEVEFPQVKSITSKDVSAYLDSLADQLATYEPDLSKTQAVAGDHVVLRLRAEREGRVVDGLTSDQVPYVVGSGILPQEVEGALASMKVGERRTLEVSLPVGTDASGAPSFALTKLTVTLAEVDRKVPARIDDLWVTQNVPQAGTLLGFRSQVRSALEREAKDEQHAQMIELTAEALSKRLTWDIPQDFADRSRDEIVERVAIDLQRQGIDLNQYISQPGFDAQGFQEQISEEAQADLRRGLALDALADHRHIEVSDAEAAQLLTQDLPGGQPNQEQETLRALRETGQIDQIRTLARRIKANEWLVKTAKDSSGPHLQLI